jgi:hypothetical protein
MQIFNAMGLGTPPIPGLPNGLISDGIAQAFKEGNFEGLAQFVSGYDGSLLNASNLTYAFQSPIVGVAGGPNSAPSGIVTSGQIMVQAANGTMVPLGSGGGITAVDSNSAAIDTVGGTASDIGNGNFSNGADTEAFAYMLNDAMDGPNSDIGSGWFKNLWSSIRGPSEGIAKYSFDGEFKSECVPLSIRTIIATETGADPGGAKIRDDIGNLNQDWNKTGVQAYMIPIIEPFELSLYNISSTVTSNYSGLSIPSIGGGYYPINDTYTETENIMKTAGPSTVVGVISDGTQSVGHAVTVQYQGGDNIVVNNIVGSGGSIYVPVKDFQGGTITSGGKTFTLNPDDPVITATGLINKP